MVESVSALQSEMAERRQGINTISLFAVNNNLLLLLQALHNTDWDLEYVGYDLGWRERKPLGQRDISHAFRLVNLNEGQVLCFRGVLDVMA